MKDTTNKTRNISLNSEDLNDAIRRMLARKGVYPPQDVVFWIHNGPKAEQITDRTWISTSWHDSEGL